MLLYKRSRLAKIIKVIPTSGVSRNKTLLKSSLLLNNTLKSLSTKFIWSSGINKSGKITVASKGKKIYQSTTPIINYKFLDNSLHFLYSVSYYKSKSLPCALFFSSSGKYSYSIINGFNEHFVVFKAKGFLDKFAMQNPLLQYSLDFPHFYILHYSLFRVAFMSSIKNLQINPKGSIQFSRSLGSYSIVLRKNLEFYSAVVKLASGVKKIFSLFSLCCLNEKRGEFHIQPKIWDKRGGYIKKIAPRSRGVAKNPVDHPHGGRTKSIKYPRTPWGKTTKFK